MQLHTKEHYEILELFERDARKRFRGRFDREDKAMWPKGRVYQDGQMNEYFIAFRLGYAAAKSIYQSEAA